MRLVCRITTARAALHNCALTRNPYPWRGETADHTSSSAPGREARAPKPLGNAEQTACWALEVIPNPRAAHGLASAEKHAKHMAGPSSNDARSTP